MPRPRSILVRIAVACALAEIGGGACASSGCCESAEQANYRRTYADARDHEIEHFEFHRPIADVWRELVAVLGEHGYTLAETSPVEGKTVETAFKPEPLGVGEYRFLVRVIRLDAARYRITLEQQFRHVVDGGTVVEIAEHAAAPERSEIAWTLIERAEPERAAEIDKRIGAKAERAGAVGRGCDRGCATCLAFVPDPPPPERR